MARKYRDRTHEYLGSHTTNLPGYSEAVSRPKRILGSNAINTERSIVHGLDFGMWVCTPEHPNDIDKALHIYTRLQGDNHLHSSAPTLLENLVDWRKLFPCLASLTDNPNESLDCDLILLEASFKLMKSYPPNGSRLRIQFELDFGHSISGDTSTLGGLKDWTYSTFIYQHGMQISQTNSFVKEVADSRVSFSLEAKWWAHLFIDVTQRKRAAEESGNREHIFRAESEDRALFNDLTAVQILRAAPSPESSYSDNPDRSLRMAVLLWKFRQTRQGREVGTTAWKKLIPPPERIAMNSPPPSAEEMFQPPLILDSMISLSKSPGGFQDHAHPSTADQEADRQQYLPLYPTDRGDRNTLVDHHSFDFFDTVPGGTEDLTVADAAAMDAMHSSFDLPPSYEDHIHDNGIHFHGGHITLDHGNHFDPQLHHSHPHDSRLSSSFDFDHNHPLLHAHFQIPNRDDELTSIFGAPSSMAGSNHHHQNHLWNTHAATGNGGIEGYDAQYQGDHQDRVHSGAQRGGLGNEYGTQIHLDHGEGVEQQGRRVEEVSELLQAVTGDQNGMSGCTIGDRDTAPEDHVFADAVIVERGLDRRGLGVEEIL